MGTSKNFVSPLGILVTTTGATEEDFNYDSGVLALAVPDFDATGVTNTINVVDDLTIEAVQIKISVDHAASIGQFGIELTSPGGTKSILLNAENPNPDVAEVDALLLSNAFYGENSLGNWTIRVVDPVLNSAGNITNWKLNFYGYAP